MPNSDLDVVREACEECIAEDSKLCPRNAAIARLVLALLPIVHVNQGHIGMKAIATCAREIRGEK